jgi:hypothetical protein
MLKKFKKNLNKWFQLSVTCFRHAHIDSNVYEYFSITLFLTRNSHHWFYALLQDTMYWAMI